MLVLFVLFGPFLIDPTYTHSGLGVGVGLKILGGAPTIDPNIAITSFALGLRAAQDAIAGHLPLWNHFQGFGAPLLGEMQSAALFPPTLLLLLPSGQALEHIFLQWLGGAGAYLFFRRFGLGTTAAIAGAILYEFNGVFATLRNAAFNPVAFLPWLLFGVESSRDLVARGRGYGERFTAICVTGAMGALALYAGFPETAYLYGLFVIAWALFRLTGLTHREAVAVFLDLSIAAGLALALSAPILVAFVTYLPEASIGGHGEEFVGMAQEKETAILYLLPYFYGNFIAAADARIGGLSISSGGYIAVAPVVLAAASLFAPGYRTVKLLLCAWLLIALGASHGWPGIYPAFMSLPLMKLAVPGRYLNPSWLFCVIFLAALMIDRLPHMTTAERRRCVHGAIAILMVVIAATVTPAAEMLPRAWQSVPLSVILSIAVGTLVTICIVTALHAPRLRRVAIAVAVLEAGALFIVPFFAYPRDGDIDWKALAFLQANTGYQRVAKTDSFGLGANFGAAFGVGLINFDDLPSPLRTIEYVRRHIDEYASNIFLPESPALAGKELSDRRRLLRQRLPAYAQAGVKYVMAAPNFYAEPAGEVIWRDEKPIILPQGGVLRIASRHTTTTTQVEALTVRTSNFRNTTTGLLAARLCSGDTCAEGTADFANIEDGQLALIPLDRPLTLEAGGAYTVEFRKEGKTAGVLWTYPRGGDAPLQRALESPSPLTDGYGIELAFVPAGRPKPVHVSRSMSIFELENVRPYASAPDCDVTLRSYDKMQTSCRRASQLVRLNVHMTGWTATVNGNDTPIGLADHTFQTIELPAGSAEVAFRYEPPGFAAAAFGAAGAALLLLTGFALAAWRRYRSRVENSADAAPAVP
ncbi:MAG: YfhO family protein [Proteobacteria bacterium]|nr:YfhO family protein [Pseudomonadota bacterium]